jgi:hypothetical protein
LEQAGIQACANANPSLSGSKFEYIDARGVTRWEYGQHQATRASATARHAAMPEWGGNAQNMMNVPGGGEHPLKGRELKGRFPVIG